MTAKHVIVTDVERADAATIGALAVHGVATVHEAMGRTGLVGPSLRPIQDGARIAGSAVTVLCWPGDNLMIHAAVEQCRPGDILVVTTVSPSLDGSFGELFATALQHRGVLGLVTTGGVRDVVDLRAMGFHVWAGAVNAQGTVKATPGSVNVPITVGGTIVRAGRRHRRRRRRRPVRAPRATPTTVLAASDARVEREAASRAAYQSGQLSLDRNDLRGVLRRPRRQLYPAGGIRPCLTRYRTASAACSCAAARRRAPTSWPTTCPPTPPQRDDLLLRIMGSPDPAQIDGLGGAHPLTSKVAIVSRSDTEPASTSTTCSCRSSSTSPPSATRRRAATCSPASGRSRSSAASSPPDGDSTTVRIRLLNTGDLATQTFPTPGGRVDYDGD